MRQRLAHGEVLLIEGPALPIGVAPGGMLGNLNDVVVTAGHQLVDLLQALAVVLDEEVDPLAHAGEGLAVGRQHQIDIVAPHFLKAIQELRQCVVGRKPRRYRRRDALQNMIAGQEDLVGGLVEADVPGIVARRLDHLELELAETQAVAIGQIRHDRVGGKRQKLRRHVQTRPLLAEGHVLLLLGSGRLKEQRTIDVALHLHEVLHLLEGVQVREHRHALAPNAVEVARVVGMRMGEHHLHLVPGAPEGGQGIA